MLNQKLKSTQSAITQQLLNFQLDSAQGRFKEAISHYQLYKVLQDSVFDEAKSKEIARLEVQYASEKKEKDLLLKESSIKALTKENLLQEEKMKKDQLIRHVITGGAVMLLLLLSVIYNRYRLKRSSNQLLEIKQQEIYNKNQSLQQVLSEKNILLAEKENLLKHKDSLIVEKEWLLKEIHHRVKNNLQIVMSLLNSQADYLQDGKALAAIKESQQRVFAISLIHQKLYHAENLALIEMDNYINEVVAYICESYNVQGQIQFNISVASLKLDVSVAIPLGLVINEAVTNSLKYAFPASRTGLISISLSKVDPEKCFLTIADDGIGLGKDFDINATHSLGMTLMKGLSEQLGGNLKVESIAGLQVSLLFNHTIPAKLHSNQLQFT